MNNLRTTSMLLIVGLTACPRGDDDTGESGPATEDTTNGTTTGPTSDPSATMTDTITAGPTTGVDTTDGTDPSATESETETETEGAVLCNLNEIELPGDAFFPEGIHADGDGNLYVGSLTTGEILRITPCETERDSHIVEVFHDGSQTMGVVGVLVDEDASRDGVLWVCSSDTAAFTEAPAILGFSLADGSLVATHEIDAGFCNDLTRDAAGNLYATESFVSRIMRVRAQDLLMDTEAQQWSLDNDYAVPPGEFGLNGIAFDGAMGNRIYAVNYTSGEMYAVPIAANGNAMGPTTLDLGVTLAGPDGLRREADNTFIVVEQAATALTRVTIDTENNTVEVIDDTFDFPTTAAIVGSHVWVVESQLDALLGGMDPDLPFVLVRREL